MKSWQSVLPGARVGPSGQMDIQLGLKCIFRAI
jgi:hypothetical protein